ncbi:MAG TPA: globin [Egibacteraceae bacterium]|nr:globin [Egibacteraceae bacterium]
MTEQTLYDAVGGEPTFRRLVGDFYRRVRNDPVLRPLYPEDQLEAAEQRLLLFLVQYWGGPTTYSQTRGHPRLRRRHMPFRIGAAERDAWLANMRAALDGIGLAPEYEQPVWDHLERAAYLMQNVADDAVR